MKDDSIRMAREAGMTGLDSGGLLENFERFAALVAAAERDACAKMVEGLFDDPNDSVLAFIVDAIRASGTRPTTVIYSPGELAARGLTHEDVVKLIKENT